MAVEAANMHDDDAMFAVSARERRVLVPAQIASAALAPASGAPVLRLGGDTMGTSWSVQCVVPPNLQHRALADHAAVTTDAAIDAAIRAALDQVIAEMSNWRDDSDISLFNRASAGSWVALPRACFAVVETALRVARLSGGAFDPCAGPLVDLWGFGPAGRRERAPAAADVDATRRACNWSRLELDRTSRRVRQPGGTSLDLCAIAKGHAVDAVADALERLGIVDRLVEIGGELRGDGVKPDGMPWWVEIETPPADEASQAATGGMPAHDLIALHGLSVATSGDYRRYFIDAAARRRYAHTIDPRTGYPADHALACVTVLHRECVLADAFSTALMVLGPDAGMTLARRQRLAARFVMRTADGFIESVSPAYAAMLA